MPKPKIIGFSFHANYRVASSSDGPQSTAPATGALTITFEAAGPEYAAELLALLQGASFVSRETAAVTSTEAVRSKTVQSEPKSTNGAAKAAVSAQSAPPTQLEPRRYKKPSPVGELDMIAHPSGLFTAQFGAHLMSDMNEEIAVAGVVDKVQTSGSPVVVPAVTQSVVTPAPEAPTKPATTPPPELLAATGFRQVIAWFVDKHGLQRADQPTIDAVLAKCVEWKSAVPCLARMDVSKDRIGRALTAFFTERGAQPSA